ncbi:O-antigen ligase family protein [Patescibacteria group bacterium]|nr:O-antigen ligase family protein [Patescibacteria group bacterium]
MILEKLSINKIFKSDYFTYTVLFSVLTLIFSFIAYLYQDFNNIAFFVYVIIFFIVSYKNLKAGMLIALAELIISSKGYILFFEFSGFQISLRIAFFVIILSIWFSKLLIDIINNKFSNDQKLLVNKKINYFSFRKSRFFKYYFIFFLVLLFAFILGILNGNGFSDTFFDMNGFLFLLYLLPFYDLFKKEDDYYDLLSLSVASSLILMFFTLFLLWIFSHVNPFYLSNLYSWLFDFGIAEVTSMSYGFSRIFMQSQIYISGLIIFLISIFAYKFSYSRIKIKKITDKNKLFILLLTLASISTILSFSRSFWVGIIASFISIFVILFIIRDKKSKLFYSFFRTFLLGITSFLIAYGFIFVFTNFPPGSSSNFTKGLNERLSNPTQEAAGSSRINMLKPLYEEIKNNFILGGGFGYKITYESADPTNVAKNVGGMYTTYALEWGYFDTLLKFGIFGFLIFIYFILALLYLSIKNINKIKKEDYRIVAFGLTLSFLFILVVNFFTPYLNHPLGIGFIIVYITYLDKNILNKKIDF